MPITQALHNADGVNLDLECKCPNCGKVTKFSVPSALFSLWTSGSPIQVALPNLTPTQHEALISGTCDTCWALIFGDPKLN